MQVSFGGLSLSIGDSHHHHHHPAPAQVRLRLSKYSYVSGEVVQGKVELHAFQPFTAQGVFVKIEGYETAKFQEVETKPPDEHGHRHRHVHVREDHHEFFCHKINVYPYTGVVQPGIMTFDFSYQLPPNLPGTFYEAGGNWDHHHATGYLGEIIYFIQAKVEVHGMEDAKEEIRFIVNERQDRALEPSFSQNSKSFLTAKGSLTTKVWLDSHSYFPGNTVLAKCEFNNTSVKPTHALFLKVYRHTNLKAHHHSKRIDTKVYEQRYPGLEPSFYGIRFLQFAIPVNMPPSSRASSRVNSRYEFIVECEIGGALNLHTPLDLQVIAPQFMFANNQPALPPLAHVPGEVSFRPPWQPDQARESCNKCNGEFGFFNRRHHCRHCGLLMCSKCAPERLPIPNLGYTEEPVLICVDCVPVVRETGGKHFQEAPAFVPHENHEIAWERPPQSNAASEGGQSSAPSVEVAAAASGGVYPELVK